MSLARKDNIVTKFRFFAERYLLADEIHNGIQVLLDLRTISKFRSIPNQLLFPSIIAYISPSNSFNNNNVKSMINEIAITNIAFKLNLRQNTILNAISIFHEATVFSNKSDIHRFYASAIYLASINTHNPRTLEEISRVLDISVIKINNTINRIYTIIDVSKPDENVLLNDYVSRFALQIRLDRYHIDQIQKLILSIDRLDNPIRSNIINTEKEIHKLAIAIILVVLKQATNIPDRFDKMKILERLTNTKTKKFKSYKNKIEKYFHDNLIKIEFQGTTLPNVKLTEEIISDQLADKQFILITKTHKHSSQELITKLQQIYYLFLQASYQECLDVIQRVVNTHRSKLTDNVKFRLLLLQSMIYLKLDKNKLGAKSASDAIELINAFNHEEKKQLTKELILNIHQLAEAPYIHDLASAHLLYAMHLNFLRKYRMANRSIKFTIAYWNKTNVPESKLLARALYEGAVCSSHIDLLQQGIKFLETAIPIFEDLQEYEWVLTSYELLVRLIMKTENPSKNRLSSIAEIIEEKFRYKLDNIHQLGAGNLLYMIYRFIQQPASITKLFPKYETIINSASQHYDKTNNIFIKFLLNAVSFYDIMGDINSINKYFNILHELYYEKGMEEENYSAAKAIVDTYQHPENIDEIIRGFTQAARYSENEIVYRIENYLRLLYFILQQSNIEDYSDDVEKYIAEVIEIGDIPILNTPVDLSSKQSIIETGSNIRLQIVIGEYVRDILSSVRVNTEVILEHDELSDENQLLEEVNKETERPIESEIDTVELSENEILEQSINITLNDLKIKGSKIEQELRFILQIYSPSTFDEVGELLDDLIRDKKQQINQELHVRLLFFRTYIYAFTGMLKEAIRSSNIMLEYFEGIPREQHYEFTKQLYYFEENYFQENVSNFSNHAIGNKLYCDQGLIYLLIGHGYRSIDDYDMGLKYLIKAQNYWNSVAIKPKRSQRLLVNMIANIYHEIGEYTISNDYAQIEYLHYVENRNISGQIIYLKVLIENYISLNNIKLALYYLDEFEEIGKRENMIHYSLAAINWKVNIYYCRGEIDKAISLFKEKEKLYLDNIDQPNIERLVFEIYYYMLIIHACSSNYAEVSVLFKKLKDFYYNPKNMSINQYVNYMYDIANFIYLSQNDFIKDKNQKKIISRYFASINTKSYPEKEEVTTLYILYLFYQMKDTSVSYYELLKIIDHSLQLGYNLNFDAILYIIKYLTHYEMGVSAELELIYNKIINLIEPRYKLNEIVEFITLIQNNQMEVSKDLIRSIIKDFIKKQLSHPRFLIETNKVDKLSEEEIAKIREEINNVKISFLTINRSKKNSKQKEAEIIKTETSNAKISLENFEITQYDIPAGIRKQYIELRQSIRSIDGNSKNPVIIHRFLLTAFKVSQILRQNGDVTECCELLSQITEYENGKNNLKILSYLYLFISIKSKLDDDLIDNIEKAKELLESEGNSELQMIYHVIRSANLDNINEAIKYLEKNQLNEDDKDPYIQAWYYYVWINLLIDNNDLKQSRKVIRKLTGVIKQNNQHNKITEIKLFSSICKTRATMFSSSENTRKAAKTLMYSILKNNHLTAEKRSYVLFNQIRFFLADHQSYRYKVLFKESLDEFMKIIIHQDQVIYFKCLLVRYYIGRALIDEGRERYLQQIQDLYKYHIQSETKSISTDEYDRIMNLFKNNDLPEIRDLLTHLLFSDGIPFTYDFDEIFGYILKTIDDS